MIGASAGTTTRVRARKSKLKRATV